MSTAATVRVLPAEEIAAQAGGSTPFLRLPVRELVFAEREMRLRQLAAGHAMGDFLRFMAELAKAQHQQLASFGSVPLPDESALSRATREGRPPLPATDWPRDPAWHGVLRALVAALRPVAPAPARAMLEQLAEADADTLERQADAVLHGTGAGLDLAAAPIIGAALQVYFTHLVTAVQAHHGPRGDAFGRTDDEALCPCCGSRPTASLTRTAGEATGQRYLHCALCNTQWHLVRIKCTHCGDTEKIAYQALDATDGGRVTGDASPTDDLEGSASRAEDAEGGASRAETAEGGATRAALAPLQAETCDACGHYLKIMHTERDPFVEPVADDLASVTLDLLVSDAGWRRHGLNLLMWFGEPPPDPGAG